VTISNPPAPRTNRADLISIGVTKPRHASRSVPIVLLASIGCGAGGPTLSAPVTDMKYRVSLTIDQIAPAKPWEGQEVVVTYTIHNGGLQPADGTVSGSFGPRTLQSMTLAAQPGIVIDGPYRERVQNVTSGKDATGAFVIKNIPSGTLKVEVTYIDQVSCITVPWNNGTQREICKAGVLARDQLDVVVQASGNILTSKDTASYVKLDPVAAGAVCGSKTYPVDLASKTVGAPNEWEDVAGNTEVPFLGRLINHNVPPLNDVVWDHPFGFDFWFNAAPDPAYFGFLTDLAIASSSDCSSSGIAANKGEQDACNSFAIEENNGRIPTGALHVEIEDRLIPPLYRPEPDDRVFMHGRRIIDCGHDNFTAEMHPPLFIASARFDASAGAVRSKLYAMPYRTLQKYEHFNQTFINEAASSLAALFVSLATAPIEFLAKVSKVPFDTKVLASYRVTMPSIAGKGKPRLRYSFHKRPGVNVTVTPVAGSNYDVDVVVTLDPSTYQPPADPDCTTVSYTPADAEKQAGLPGGSLNAILMAAAHVPVLPLNVVSSLALGLRVKSCNVPGPAPFAPGTTPDNRVVEVASQASPVYGWLDWEYDTTLVNFHVDRTGLGRVTAAGGIDCGATCDAPYPNGNLVTLVATPDPGWQFDSWGGACQGQTTSSCTATINTPLTTVAARFVPVAQTAHTLTIDIVSDPSCSAAGAGMVTAGPYIVCRSFGSKNSCTSNVPDGVTVNVVATTPGTGSNFVGFGGACSGTSCSVTITRPTIVSASFCGLVR
jgi:hypothetical protein